MFLSLADSIYIFFVYNMLVYFRERLQGDRGGNSTVYRDAANYLYIVNKRTINDIYFQCRSKNECPGKITIRDGTQFHITEHNHEPNLLEVQIAQFKTSLRYRSAISNDNICNIYREEEIRFPEAARVCGGFASVRSLMYRARKIGTAAIPHDLEEYADTMNQYVFRYCFFNNILQILYCMRS